jgi:uncharacterized oxidoreductase
MMKLANRTVLITGGTSGIGFALARLLLERGNTVIVTGRDPGRIAATERALPGVHVFPSDVTRPADVAALRDRVLARFPSLDILVNNAGIMRNLDFAQPGGPADVTREIETNLCGPVRMVEQFLPHLRSREHAMIVNVSSGLAFVPLPLSPVYSATKAAIHSFTQALRVQLAGTNVTVVELAPPPVETPLLRGEFAEEMRNEKAMDAAVLVAQAVRGIEAGRLEIRPGLSNVLKVMSRVAPSFMLAQLAKAGRKTAKPPAVPNDR